MHATQALIGQYLCLDQAIRTREFQLPLNFFYKILPNVSVFGWLDANTWDVTQVKKS